MAERTLSIAAAIILNSGDEMLLVRKKGTSAFMQPGGKIDRGETAVDALLRELREEITLDARPDALTFEGVFSEEAANEPGMEVVAHTFSLRLDAEIKPEAEIAEACWVTLGGNPDLELAPLTRNHMLPLARKKIGASA